MLSVLVADNKSINYIFSKKYMQWELLRLVY